MNGGENHPFMLAMDNFLLQEEDGLLPRAKKKGWEQFKTLGIPTRKSEAFQYVKLRSILHGDYVAAKPATSSLSFDLPDNVTLLPLTTAAQTYGTLLSNQWNQTIKEEKDPFVLLNLALHQEGFFIYIPPKTVLKTPLNIVHLLESKGLSTLVFPRIHIFIGAHAEVTLVTTNKFLGPKTASNCVWQLALEEGAKVDMVQESWGAQENSWSFDAVRAQLKRDAKLSCTHATDGSTATRFDYKVHLLGENSEVSLSGLSLLRDKQEAHQHLLIEHHAPHCRSHQLFKGVLDDFSRTGFEGKIYVHQAAQQTEAYQLNNNVLLSDKAQAYSKPNLEIFADDVKASHGATVGHLDKEQEFYLRTRGLDQKAARSALIQGFCTEVIEKVNIPSVREKWTNHVSSYFGA